MAWNPIWNPTEGIICLDLPAVPDQLEICFPGGFCLSHIWQGIDKIPTGADLPLQFFGQIGPAMAFMKPVFTILDTALAIYRCVTAVPDAILKLDPGAIFECMPELVALINELLSLIPQLSLPRMVKQILIGLAQLLEGVASDYQYLLAQYQRVIDEIDRAADLDDVTLNDFLTCRQNTITDTAMSTSEALQGIGRIVLLANVLIGLFGGDVEIPCFNDMIDLTNLQSTVDLLLELAAYLRQLAALIPDPQYTISLALSGLKC